MSFVAADALAYLRGLEPDALDVIVCFEGIEHLDDVEYVARELVRLVRGGVGMIASVPNSATFEDTTSSTSPTSTASWRARSSAHCPTP